MALRCACRCSLPLIAVVLATSCDSAFGLERIPRIDAAPPPDAMMPKPFDAPVPIAELNTTNMEEDDPSLTGDLLELYFLRNTEIWRSTRVVSTVPWGIPGLVMQLNTADTELRPSVAADGLTLYLSRGSLGNRDVYVSTRGARGQAWGTPTLLALDLNRPGTDEHVGWSSPDGLALIVESQAAPGADHDLYLATRVAVGVPFTSQPLTALNTDSNEGGGWATADGQRVLFESDRNGELGIFEAIRDGDTWNVFHRAELDTPATEGTPWLSADGTIVVFSRTDGPTDDLYMATR